MDLQAVLFESGSPLLAAVALASATASGFATWLIGARNISSALERTRVEVSAEILATEATERASFRTALQAELATLRTLIKECEAGRDRLRDRLNAAEGQILILKASNEILEKWMNFLRTKTGGAAMPTVSYSLPSDVPPMGG